MKRLAFVSYSKGDLTSFNGSKSIYRREDGDVALERIKSGNLAESGEFSFSERDSRSIKHAKCWRYDSHFSCEKIWKHFDCL